MRSFSSWVEGIVSRVRRPASSPVSAVDAVITDRAMGVLVSAPNPECQSLETVLAEWREQHAHIPLLDRAALWWEENMTTRDGSENENPDTPTIFGTGSLGLALRQGLPTKEQAKTFGTILAAMIKATKPFDIGEDGEIIVLRTEYGPDDVLLTGACEAV